MVISVTVTVNLNHTVSMMSVGDANFGRLSTDIQLSSVDVAAVGWAGRCDSHRRWHHGQDAASVRAKAT